MKDKGVIVLGAGLAGLSAAWQLQAQGRLCRIYEKEAEVGGLSRSKKVQGYTFDTDGHLFHFRSGDSFKWINEMLQNGLVKHERNAWVYFQGRFIKYPFQAHLSQLPEDIREECEKGLVKAQRNGPADASKNFLSWVLGTFGEGIAKHFMIPYNTKFWQVPLRSMTGDWTRGFVPPPALFQVDSRAGKRASLGYHASFWYPQKGGVGALSLALKGRLEHVHIGHEVKIIDIKKRRIVFANGIKKDYEQLVSTLPLPELATLLTEMPERVKTAFSRLRWNSVFNLNLGLKQRNPSKKHWIYFPQKDISFFRVGFYHCFSEDLVPLGGSSLYAEVAYSDRRQINKAVLGGRIERDLRKVGLIANDDEILVRDINDIKYAYPVYDRNYASVRKEILDFLKEQHIYTCGRYGNWQYMSMEGAMCDGLNTGKLLADYE